MATPIKCKLVVADGHLKNQVIMLLKQNSLQTNDLGEDKILFALLHNELVIGTGGLELFADCALIRSISIKKELQGNGLGKLIVEELEKKATKTELMVCTFSQPRQKTSLLNSVTKSLKDPIFHLPYKILLNFYSLVLCQQQLWRNFFNEKAGQVIIK
ncbi:MAG TPA: GNAT family N-acetyltransferase [Chitinophagaceae bacterium]